MRGKMRLFDPSQITGPFALAAFLAAAVVYYLALRSKERQKAIERAAPTEAIRLVSDALPTFTLNLGNLAENEKVKLAIEELRQRQRRFIISAVVVVILAIVSAVLTFALARTGVPAQAEPEKNAARTVDRNDSGVLQATVDTAQFEGIQAGLKTNQERRENTSQPSSPRTLSATSIKSALCSESQACNGIILACQTSGERPSEVNQGVWLYGPNSKEFQDNVQGVGKTDVIKFGRWTNEQCGLSGNGWYAKIGTCGTSRGDGFQRCLKELIVVQARDFVRGEGIALQGTSGAGYGANVLLNAPDYRARPNAAEFEFQAKAAGSYRLVAEYVAEQARTVRILLNGKLIMENALNSVTGCWQQQCQRELNQGRVELKLGWNVMRVERNDVFPHIKQFRFEPIY